MTVAETGHFCVNELVYSYDKQKPQLYSKKNEQERQRPLLPLRFISVFYFPTAHPPRYIKSRKHGVYSGSFIITGGQSNSVQQVFSQEPTAQPPLFK